jgi:hypothetical protein
MNVNEYNEARSDIVDQLEEFSKSLEKMKSGVQRIQNFC